jgi:hypothetical protein
MAEAYSTAGEISDTCQANAPILVDGVSVPQYWSVANNSCWPPPDPIRLYPPLPIHAPVRVPIKAFK